MLAKKGASPKMVKMCHDFQKDSIMAPYVGWINDNCAVNIFVSSYTKNLFIAQLKDVHIMQLAKKGVNETYPVLSIFWSVNVSVKRKAHLSTLLNFKNSI